ncbi:MAG: Rne/Rng family ribonuclease, partial [Alcanivoracaceae bacterium]|nr:Rne/Rng family ribonuclease [Alcanivoracaceae bacterium]
MLINATHPEEIRVALADGQKLYNLDIDVPGQDRKKGNIYKGKITRVEPSLEAAFVDYGANRHGFLPYKEISRNYYTEAANKAKERPPIAKAIKEGTEVIIQVNKEERGNKGAAISTYISLAGRYMVYMPENPKAGGISRRIEGEARQDLKATLSKVDQPKNSGLIVRTAGIGRTVDELAWDLNYLDQVWTAIKTVAANRKAPFFIYQESDIFIRALRDYLRPDVGEILIDNKEIYEKARDFMQQVMPHNLKKLSFYNDTIPLFSRYQIESQIQSAFSREVRLPSGGSLVIDHTEAMISIDINSARATKGADIEETALNTNLEAADEIARQLRIRDLGGLVVIDFIDMRSHKNQRSVEQQLNEAVSNDRARIQTSKISRFGLLEMSRQRLKSSINESSQFTCPRCSGHGFIRNIESLSVSILRLMEEEALKPETGKVIAQVPTKVANFIMNEKRQELNSLESRHSVPMLIIANEYYQSPQFDVKRLKKSESGNIDVNCISLNKPESEESAENKSSQASHQHRELAAVDVLTPDSQAPARVKSNGITSWLKSLFTSNTTPVKTAVKSTKKPQHSSHKQHNAVNKQQGKHPQKNKPHNKPKNTQANKQQNKQHNKQQATKTTKQQPVKQQNKQPNKQPNKQTNKQLNKQPNKQENKQLNKQPNKQPQANKPSNEQKQQKQTPANVPAQVKDQVTETLKTNEQMLQRPLGSVASYAANKAKQVDPVKENKDTKQQYSESEKTVADKEIKVIDKKKKEHAQKPQTEKTKAENKETTNKNDAKNK